MNKSFRSKKFLSSFKHAIAGFKTQFKEERNARFHFFATLLVIAASLLLPLSKVEYLFIIIAIAWVWFAEFINTAIENLCDLVHPEYHPRIKVIKDLSAAAVLLSAIVASMLAAFIFLPHLWEYLK